MTLAARLARHDRQRRVIKKLRERRLVVVRVSDPGPLMDFVPRLQPQFSKPLHLRPLVDAIELSTTERVEVAVDVPVRHGKTSLLKTAVPWWLLKNPAESILYVSYAHGFAQKQVSACMELARRAGVALGKVQRAGYWTTAAGGQVVAAGVGGQLAGEGFTKIIIDDPHKNRAEAESRIMRERVEDGYYSDVYTRQDPRGTSVFIVHARWHVDDLIGKVTKNGRMRRIHLPALDASGEALAPWLWPTDRLREIEATIGPYAFASLYQGEPRPRGGALFTNAVLIDELAVHGSYRYAIGVDLARTAKTRSDHNVAVVMRKNLDTDMVDVVDVARAQSTLTDRVRDDVVDPGFAGRIAGLQQRFPGARTVMYTGHTEDLTLALLARLKDHACRVEAMQAVTDKWTRAQPYAAAWNRGRVRVLRPGDAGEHAWANDYIGEHVAFTGVKGDQDDQVDAGAAAFDALEGDGKTSLAEAMAKIGRIA